MQPHLKPEIPVPPILREREPSCPATPQGRGFAFGGCKGFGLHSGPRARLGRLHPIPRLHRDASPCDLLDLDHPVVAGAANAGEVLAKLRRADADLPGEVCLALAFEVLLESLHTTLLAIS